MTGSAARDCRVLDAGPVTTVDEVIDRLGEIRHRTGGVAPGCGIAEFSDLYLTITTNLAGKIRTGAFFDDDTFLGLLVTAFANRYLDALRAWAAHGETTPKVWEMLFDVPGDGEITSLQLAGAGVNAHINLDLAVAVVTTGRLMGVAGIDAGTHHADFERVNTVFGEEMDGLLARLTSERAAGGEPTGHLSFVGRLMTEVVAIAREMAWHDAGDLWLLVPGSDGWRGKERRMDHKACLMGRLLLADLPL